MSHTGMAEWASAGEAHRAGLHGPGHGQGLRDLIREAQTVSRRRSGGTDVAFVGVK